MGNRIGKSNFDGTNTNSTWYIRDASGNNMATYNQYNDQGLYIDEFNIYGSSRLGTFKTEWQYPITEQPVSYVNGVHPFYLQYPTGFKQYQLTNHLGNVLSTISDQKTPVNNDSDPETDYFTAIVKTQQDYYPFGMMMPSRTCSLGGDYSFGFNGVEKDEEIGVYTAEFWEYDARTGRRWNMDMVLYPWQSPYTCFNNNPIYFKDPSGLEGEEGNKEVQKHKIAKGETLTGIAKKFNTSVETLAKWNNIVDVNKIFTGTELTVSDPTRPAAREGFDSDPANQGATGWTLNGDKGGETTVTNGIELGLASMGNKDVAHIGGQLLEKVKSDPGMQGYQTDILNDVKADPRYGKEAFYLMDQKVVGFGGKRWRTSDESWRVFDRSKNPLLHLSTYMVVSREVTLALRNATVKYWVEVNPQGVINIQYRLYDTLDLSGQGGRGQDYNDISNILGFGYHDMGGGNKNLQTKGTWSVTIK